MIAQIELWLLRSLAAGAVLWFVGALIYHKGEASKQAEWDASNLTRQEAEDSQNAKNAADTMARQGKVVAAEAAQARAESDLAVYRRTHPIPALACGLRAKATDHPADASQGTGDGKPDATAGTGGVLLTPAQGDIGDQLDALMADADRINSAYRVCLATRPN